MSNISVLNMETSSNNISNAYKIGRDLKIMIEKLEEFDQDYYDLVEDIYSAGYNTYEAKLGDFFNFIDDSTVSSSTVKSLETGVNFGEWYEEAKNTVKSMVGSGKLNWSKNRTDRLGQYISLFRYFSAESGAFIDFSSKFLFAGSNFDDIIQKINSEYFESFTRDLLKKIHRDAESTQVKEKIPASDRIVVIDHNSLPYLELSEKLASVEEGVAQSNELSAQNPDEVIRIVSEISAGRRLLKSARMRLEAIISVLVSALKWVVAHAIEGTVGALATAALLTLANVLGISIPWL